MSVVVSSTGNSKRIVRLIQITDCHLGPEPGYRLAGITTLAGFKAVLDHVAAQVPSPDKVMVSGDIAAHGSPQAYHHFIEAMAQTGLAYSWLPGNHDDFALMNQLDSRAFCAAQDVENWRILSLNTAVPHRVAGRLSEEQLALVEQNLQAAGDANVVIFMHHPPADVGCRWLDRQQVANGDELAAVINGHSCVKALFTGHVHQQGAFRFAGVPLYSTPSTCFQFAANQEDFALAELPPGYRWIDLMADGRFSTGVVFLDDYPEKVDTGVHGY